MVDYTKYRVVNYFPYEPPDEYRRTFFIDELNKISHVIDQFAQEFYPAKNVVAKTVNYTATILDDVLLCSGSITITLFDAGGKTDANGLQQNAGRRITVKNTGVGTITIDPAGSQTIDGASTKTLPTQYDVVELVSDGSNWFVI